MTAKPAVAFLAALGAVVAAVLAGFGSTRPSNPAGLAQRASRPHAPQVTDAYGRLPIHFELNAGQTEPRVRFLARGGGYALFLTADGAVLNLSVRGAQRGRQPERGQEASRSSVLCTRLLGGNVNPKVRGGEEQPGRANYFLGNDPRKWRRGVPLYGRVAYEGVYPGIDLVYYGNQRQLEYDFIVAPHADPRSIRMRFDGARGLSLDETGDLRIALDRGEVVHHAPRVRQRTTPSREAEVEGRWSISGLEASFELGRYDSSQELTIDPALEYSTYLGGASNYDAAHGVAVDGAGAAYIAGETPSPDFPTQNPLQGGLASARDAFVTKLVPGGDSLVYSTFLGGSGEDVALGLAIDSLGSAYVAGYTESGDFPTQSPLQVNQPGTDAFVAKITPAGDQLSYSTYLGGSDDDRAKGIAVDSSRNVYLAGVTGSTDFPTVNPLYAYAGEFDAFVARLSATGTAIEYSTFVGGQGRDEANAIAVDDAGSAYLAGNTASSDFPTKWPLLGYQGALDTFVTKITATGDRLVYSTYLGGTEGEEARGIAVDGSGAAYVTGYTSSPDFPTRNAVQSALAGYYDAFVSKLSAAGDALEYSTYLGGSQPDLGQAIAVDAVGEAHLTGNTESPDFQVRDPYQSYQGAIDAFVTKLSSGGDRLLYSTFLGGPFPDAGLGIALDGAGSVYVTGFAYEGFPTVRPYQVYQGQSDAFVTKIGPPSPTSFYTVTPCRVVDTRNPSGPFGGPPLTAGANRSFSVAGQCDIPPTARAVALNLTVTQPTVAGNLRVNPISGGLPPTSAINYSAGQTRANSGVVLLGTSGALTVRCNQSSGTVHLVLDVSGYFE